MIFLILIDYGTIMLKKLFCLFFTIVGIGCAQSAEKSGEITVHELKRWLDEKKNFVLIDVRTPGEHSEGYIPGTGWNIDYRELERRIGETAVPRDKTIVVYCRSGRRSSIAKKTLTSMGFKNVINLKGSMIAWGKARYPVAN
ncbi:MAG TPA: rhodanese-like domain-containing protein [bacterium]